MLSPFINLLCSRLPCISFCHNPIWCNSVLNIKTERGLNRSEKENLQKKRKQLNKIYGIFHLKIGAVHRKPHISQPVGHIYFKAQLQTLKSNHEHKSGWK